MVRGYSGRAGFRGMSTNERNGHSFNEPGSQLGSETGPGIHKNDALRRTQWTACTLPRDAALSSFYGGAAPIRSRIIFLFDFPNVMKQNLLISLFLERAYCPIVVGTICTCL